MIGKSAPTNRSGQKKELSCVVNEGTCRREQSAQSPVNYLMFERAVLMVTADPNN